MFLRAGELNSYNNILELSIIYGGVRTSRQYPRSMVNLKVKLGFSTNKGRNKCNTFSLCNFDQKIHSLYYFHDSRSSSKSKGQLQGQVIENLIFTK